MKRHLELLILTFVLGSIAACNSSSHRDSHDTAIKAVKEIEQSHIDGNVPANDDFHKFLVRDLEKYFSSRLKHKVRVDYDLLRNAPTQSGIAFPKYYAWVRIYGSSDELNEEGAVRIAAEGKTVFDVTDFWNVKKIQDDEKNLELTFPKNLCSVIVTRSKAASSTATH